MYSCVTEDIISALLKNVILINFYVVFPQLIYKTPQTAKRIRNLLIGCQKLYILLQEDSSIFNHKFLCVKETNRHQTTVLLYLLYVQMLLL
jgi:hypothetical protein